MESNNTPFLFVCGLSHHTAPLAVRELWALNGTEKAEVLASLAEDGYNEAVILGTCNRTEFYLTRAGRPPLEAIQSALARIKGKTVDLGDHAIFTLQDKKAVTHLFHVAGGLDSQILGETEIQGQVKQDLQLSKTCGACGGELSRLFERALKVGKRIRSETRISEGVLSAGQAAVLLAQKILGPLQAPRVLLIGTGDIGRLTAQALAAQGAASLTITSRTADNAEKLASEFQARTVPFDESVQAIAQSDLVISSTASPVPLFNRQALEPLCRGRSERPLVVIDLAVPRDFDRDVGDMDYVFLHDLDDLEAVIEQSRKHRKNELPRCTMIIQEEVGKFLAQRTFRHEIEPLVKRLMAASEAWQQAMVEESAGHLPGESRAEVQAITRRLVRRLLLFPVNRLKGLRDRGDLSAEAITLLKELFEVNPNDDTPSGNPGQ